MKEEFYKMVDIFLMWGLFFWRFLFYTVLIVMGILTILGFSEDNKFIYFLWLFYAIVFIGKAVSCIGNFIETIKKDLFEIKEKLGLKPRHIDWIGGVEERAGIIKEWLNEGKNITEIRESYIFFYGFRRWLTDGRGLAEYLIKENKTR